MTERPTADAHELLELSLPFGEHAQLLRIAAAAGDSSGDVRTVAREAAADPAFAALLLRLANSAERAARFRAADLPTAVNRLGLRLVRTLAIAAPALRLLEASPRDDLSPARRSLHEHSVRTGVTARLLALPTVEPEAALAAGLLHNIGLMLVSVHAPDVFRHLVELAREGERLAHHEPVLLGMTHAELGARLAEQWSYPPLLVDAILEHDFAEPERPLARVVRVADILTRWADCGVEAREPLSDSLLAPKDADAEPATSTISSRDLAICLLDVA